MTEKFEVYKKELEKLGLERELTQEEKRIIRIQNEIQEHLDKNNRTVGDEYELIAKKESKLSFRCREYINNLYN